MRKHVLREISSRRERLAARLAAMWHFPRMSSPHVLCEMRRSRKRLTARLAAMWLLLRVRPRMYREAAGM